MYSRKFDEPPVHIINNGKAEFGTYKGISESLSIKGMRSPYLGLVLPSFISKYRIKSRLNYIFETKNFIGMTEFFDLRFFGSTQIVFWNKETGRKYSYFCFLGTRKRIVPKKSTAGTCTSFRKFRYIKVFWGRNHEHLAMRFNVKGDKFRPCASGAFFSPAGSQNHTDFLFVNPAPTCSRCSATWVTSMDIQGKLSINSTEEDNSKGLALLCLNRTYYKFHSNSTQVWGIGEVKNDKVIFQLKTSNMDAVDPDKYNDNILIVNGEETALPSVVMTHPFGINKDWIIQDTESMIDLTFTPISINSNTRNIIAMRTSYATIYGHFNGVLLDKNEKKIVLKNFSGIINRNMIRL